MATATSLATSLGLHRVVDPDERLAGVLPQAAWRLDPSPRTGPGEVRIRVDRLNLDAASYRQLSEANDGDGDAIRAAVAEIIASRGKMHNPVTGSGGMLTGVVEEAGPDSPLGLKRGDRIATLVSLTLTPLEIYDSLVRWDGLSEQVPCDGHAILFARSIAAVLPADLPAPMALSVMDVCGAPALTRRVVGGLRGDFAGSPSEHRRESPLAPPSSQAAAITPHTGANEEALPPSADNSKKRFAPIVAVIGAAGKSGSLSAAAAREAGAAHIIGVVPTEAEASLLRGASASGDGGRGGVADGVPKDCRQQYPLPPAPLTDEVVIADARQPLLLAEAVAKAGGPADVTVVCVDVAGCEGGAILATKEGGTVIFFSMATNFSAAALGAEGVAADVTMLVGNGYVPGHAELALNLIRTNGAVRGLFERRIHAPVHPAQPDECDIQPVIGGSMSHSSGEGK
jgi:L-erythro-3,5-diaminohexanoate dehydrogenase